MYRYQKLALATSVIGIGVTWALVHYEGLYDQASAEREQRLRISERVSLVSTKINVHLATAQALQALLVSSLQDDAQQFRQFIAPFINTNRSLISAHWLEYSSQDYQVRFGIGPTSSFDLLPTPTELSQRGPAFIMNQGQPLLIVTPAEHFGQTGAIVLAVDLASTIAQSLGTNVGGPIHVLLYSEQSQQPNFHTHINRKSTLSLATLSTSDQFWRKNIAQHFPERVTQRLELGQHTFTLVMAGRNGSLFGISHARSWLGSFAGLMLTLMLALCVWRVNQRHKQSTQVVDDQSRALGQSQRQLESSEARYNRAVQGAGVGMWEWQVTTGELYTSPRVRQLIGLDLNEPFTLDQWLARIHLDDRDNLMAEVQRHFETGLPFHHQYRLQHVKGYFLWVHVHGVAVKNATNEPICMAGSILDISDAKREEAIIELLYRITLDSNLDFNAKLQTMLNAGQEYFGLERGVITRVENNELAITVVSPIGSMPMGSRFPLGQTFCGFAYGTEGVKAWHHVQKSELNQEDCYHLFKFEAYIGTSIFAKGELIGTLAFVDSAPQAAPFSARAKTFVRLLAHWIGSEYERSKSEAQRNELIVTLSQSNEALERFAYVCSHDLQEPLRMINVFSKKIELQLEELNQVDDKITKYLHFMQDGATRAQALIRDVLSYSQVGQNAESYEMIDAGLVVESIVMTMRQGTQALNSEESGDQESFSVYFDQLPTVYAKQSQLYQLLQNLIQNSIKYQPAGAHAIVNISARTEGKFWHFEVKDNGIGIDPTYAHEIFEIFKRLHHRRDYQGTGIGLAVCKKIIDGHGGEIWVESALNEGACFHFKLPKRLQNNASENQLAS